ncbi:glycerol-3-phosphate 1-O-acyltransferase PlsY [Frigidibacter sp. ROC022]|uniref:glycerol-3-phosphate 1-O-acyltransferase PlsY n=1 Tax=Frigidibacter sp. ROC022 TaxID=2971796 RepID=UPI00215B1FCC|nr:glycerol-3-phosphate 1-O-acyltransferase PlsY [Frigidibacter sp. ROC022]MCR8726608.1 glycerol-3-phosphate 1-O-acyltransferase PlsY [Frigidibacter sp. ROC022]
MPEFVTPNGLMALTALAAYLLGSVPFGIVMARLFGLGDLRRIGSGNIGATNVLRTGNKTAAALTVVFDAGKGGVAVLLARWLLAEDAAQLAGLAAFLGHCFPIWLRFRGGKGMATFLGTLLALYWPLGLACCATWLVMAAASRYSSAAALVSVAMSPLWAVLLGRSEYMVLTTLLALIVWYRHRDNIKRLKAGTETRIGQKG